MPDNTNDPVAPTDAATNTPVLRKTIETWQVEKGVAQWLIAFVKILNRWPDGRELTADEFDAAIRSAFDVAFR